ncbi:MAG: diaminopimelate epimerase [Candidatus Bathyarchaeia archaeon]|nr:diaminopimelate epimerase [Candidatus Bathyarchaeota archaeon]
MVRLPFWKMHGLGNDYIVIDNRNGILENGALPSIAKRLCRRRFSIGADGLLLLYNSSTADVKMRIFNADGSEAEMCGNGIRCLAKYCYENGIVCKSVMDIETLAGVRRVWLHINDGKVASVTVDMGSPIFDRKGIPALGEGKFIDESINVNGETFKATCLSIGNPHCVIFVDDVASFPVEYYGPRIEKHALFPKRINVEFVQIIRPDLVKVRVWERGVGETFACGTGACASVVAGRVLGMLSDECLVELLGGNLRVRYDEASNRILLTGLAEKVYEGVVELEVLP